ncbi:TonB-dependent receptor plug domain-containing protein, partial [Asticcacaulis biprosthecium]
SLNFPRPSATDGTDNVRPASLRGLAPDQTLVLVDGKRRHASALVNVNGSAGRGSSAVDLNAIPAAALDKVEILRDGASAQYGSDAIAGVVNLGLRRASKGGNLTFSYGEYDTDFDAANSERHINDGGTTSLNGWVGLPLGSDGYLTISGELRRRNPTNRADVSPVVTPARVTSRYGDPEQKDLSLFFNAGKPINETWTAYGNLGFRDLNSESAAFYRHANSSGNSLAVYPNGFLPIINARSKDISATAGVRGTLGGWTSDVSVTGGDNELDYYTLNSLNPSYGTASQHDFYSGQLKYGQTVVNADLSRDFEVAGWAGPLSVAVGLEARNETYQITAGELQSYALGTDTTKSAGAQGFIGLRPNNEIEENRSSAGIYVDVAGQVTDRFSFDTALRYEDYSDFGGNLSGKVAGRYEFSDSFALRGSLSTGFRAPSLAQQYFTSTASVVTGGVVVETGTFPATAPVSLALGAEPLEAETSTSSTLGAVWRSGPFELTVDAYQIDIDDRIVLSENISAGFSPQVAALLAPYNVSAARFFINGVDTTTTGIDVVAAYRLRTDSVGNFTFTGAYNHNETEIDRLPTLTNSPLSPQPPLFIRTRQLILTNSAPETKASVAVDWQKHNWSVNARATYYGDVVDPAAVEANDIHTGEKTITDLSASYRFGTGTTLSVGADNVFDVYPDATPTSLNITSGNGAGALAFSRFSPFGFNGRFVYARVSQSW